MVADGEVVVAPRACRVRHLLDRGLPVGPGRVAVEISSHVVELDEYVRGRPQRKLSQLRWKPLEPERGVHRLLARAVRQLTERVDVLGRARRFDQGRAETMRLGDDERDRNTLDGDTDDATFVPFDDGDDHRKSLGRCERRPRIHGSAHDRQVERELAEAPRITCGVAAQCVRDRPSEGAGTVHRQAAARTWRKREGSSDLRLGAATDPRHRAQTAVLRRLLQLLCRLDAERAADVERSSRRQTEKPPEPDQLGVEALYAGRGALRSRPTRPAHVAGPRCSDRCRGARAPSGAHELRDRRRSRAHGSPARRYARAAYGLASASSSSAAYDSSSSAIAAFVGLSVTTRSFPRAHVSVGDPHG